MCLRVRSMSSVLRRAESLSLRVSLVFWLGRRDITLATLARRRIRRLVVVLCLGVTHGLFFLLFSIFFTFFFI